MSGQAEFRFASHSSVQGRGRAQFCRVRFKWVVKALKKERKKISRLLTETLGHYCIISLELLVVVFFFAMLLCVALHF